MFILKKIIAPFLMPPGLLILLLALYGGWLKVVKKRRGWKTPVVVACVLWVFSLWPVSGPMVRWLESDFYHCEVPSGDVIILLGGGIVQGAPDLTGAGFPSDLMLGRMVTAVRLAKRLDLPIIATGGKGLGSLEAEAPVIKRVLMDLGVPGSRIFMDDKASDTMENARFSKAICLENNFTRPILVTSAYHMKRSLLSFKRAGLDVAPYPAAFKSSPRVRRHWSEILPSAGALSSVSMCMHELLGILFYSVFY